MSEHAAYARIEAARVARRIPDILQLLADGSVTLTTIGLLAPQLTPENQRELLQAARHKSKREVERIVAALRPLPDVPSSVRKLPAPKEVRSAPTEVPVSPALGHDGLGDDPTAATAMVHMNPPAPLPRPAVVAPLAPERYKVQVTISRDAHDKLRRAQDLLRHVIPNGDPAAIFERHLVPFADGGATDTANLQLRCRAHNTFEAEAWFGLAEMQNQPDPPTTRSGPSSKTNAG